MRNLVLGLGWQPAPGGCASAGPLGVGDAAPPFELKSVAGGEVPLEAFRGKPVLLYFHMAVG